MSTFANTYQRDTQGPQQASRLAKQDAFSAFNRMERPALQVLGHGSLHWMIGLQLAERMPGDGRLLVLGVGGGMEIKALAQEYSGWRFIGVDPLQDMLDLAGHTTAPHRERVELHHGYIDAAPSGLFNGAVSLLTFHSIPHAKRLVTLTALRARLRPGAPLVVMHISLPEGAPERSRWLARYLTLAGVPDVNAADAKDAMQTQLSILSPEEDEALLRQAGFRHVNLFFSGLSFKGWVAYA